ncbi:hypothetical protein GCM10029992_28240 [Glycomyces albus]
MRVTLKDIAEEAGVSLMTVSNVVNGKKARVSEATRSASSRSSGSAATSPALRPAAWPPSPPA